MEFGDSEHTGASGTAKLVGNECWNVEKRVRVARKMQKSQNGAHCHVSADATVRGHVSLPDWLVNDRAGAASARHVSGCAWATVRVEPARVSACGLTGAPIRSIPVAAASF